MPWPDAHPDRPTLMGILNVTPDSFSDGGRFRSTDAAIAAALAMVDDGAAIIDVGGESTRPGAARVPIEEQIDRTQAVVAGIAARSDVRISIDTTRAAVAEAALDAGAHIINDVSAADEDATMLDLAAARQCGLILMHRLRTPDRDQYSDAYGDASPTYDGDVVASVIAWLATRIERALDAGVAREHLVADPGLGFGKTVEQNYELIAAGAMPALGVPILSAASRKSFIGAVSDTPEPAERVAGSIAVSVAHYLHGVRLFRVHDVAAQRQALAVAAALELSV